MRRMMRMPTTYHLGLCRLPVSPWRQPPAARWHNTTAERQQASKTASEQGARKAGRETETMVVGWAGVR